VRDGSRKMKKLITTMRRQGSQTSSSLFSTLEGSKMGRKERRMRQTIEARRTRPCGNLKNVNVKQESYT
jgi:hypothetical protein